MRSVEALQWLAYIGRTRGDLLQAFNGRELHVPEVRNVKVNDKSAKTQEVFEYLGCFGMGGLHAESTQAHGNTDEKLLNSYEEATAKIQKIENAGCFDLRGARLENT